MAADICDGGPREGDIQEMSIEVRCDLLERHAKVQLIRALSGPIRRGLDGVIEQAIPA